ncbi:6-phospho-beta-glucosidase [Rathayibacter sp. PhB152]|uniref:6-phospho-beta-glucosidase n=1 Tax=unclassified Rathayibacter TaxID=2609250 RepID=UPI000F4B9945|nr:MULTISPECIES: 6-phospho-beta-glucosidase [unclassified Rathayibacter]ROQ60454.1 6-phospho-beta-glucosidase [Rathayibacter sp. PhB152]ROS21625.1 6-phospho-beta-glucosidase [Rathayibacter sp. PhB127]
MKLVLLGGGGFRVPLVFSALVRDHEPGRVTSVALVDTDRSKLEVTARILAEQSAPHADAPVVSIHTDLEEALPGADFVFSAIRVGGMTGRWSDERIGLSHGVIGQETVGYGGISYALRTLPVVMRLAETIKRLAPEAWVINFTNPAGVVTEAMSQVLGDRVIGICDSPIGLARRALGALGVQSAEARIEYAGLNHLGWVRSLVVDGVDRLPELLEQPERLESFEEGRLFGADWIRTLGVLPNEYLHYYSFTREVLHADQLAPRSRGGYLVEQQGRFYAEAAHSAHSPLALWEACRHDREQTYMASNRQSVGMGERDEDDLVSGGYEDVAIALMRGIAHDQSARLILNVPNRGVLDLLDDEAVVEVPCIVDATGAHPVPGSSIPDFGRGLVTSVKYVERQTIEAALSGSRAAAVRALAHHPLIDSVGIARALLEDATATFGELAYLR